MGLARAKVGSTTPLAVASILTAFHALYGGVPKPNAVRLALPILFESGWPGTYPASDILVQSLQHSGFHVYVLMGRLAALGVPINAMFYAGLLVTTFAFVWMAYEIALYLTDSSVLAICSAAVLMAMPAPRGTLVWSDLPWPEFITGSLAMPMVMLVAWCGWHRHWLTAGILTGVACIVHPSMGSIAAALMAASSVLYWHDDRASIVRGWIAAGVTAAPNVYLMARDLFGSTAGSVSTAGYLELMAPFQGHLHLRTHLEGGIGFYSGLLLLTVMGIGVIPRARRRHAISALVVFHLIIAAYIVGVEVLRSTFISLFFWFRTTSFLKIFAIPVGLSLVVRQRPTLGARPQAAVVGLLIGAASVNNMIAAEGFLFGAIAILLWQRRTIAPRALAAALVLLALVSFASIGWRRLGIPVAPPATLLLLAVARGILPLIALPFAWGSVTDDPAPGAVGRHPRAWIAGLAAFMMLAVALRHPYDLHASTFLPESPAAIRSRIEMVEPAGDLAGVERWARRETARSALFVLPPELDASVEFRARARRGVFVTLGDLAILTYAPATFLEARRRAEMVGVRLVAGRPDVSLYDTLDDAAIARLRHAGATHIVLRRADAPPRMLPVAYSDSAWTVYALEPGT